MEDRNNATLTNVLLMIALLLIVGFGVWYVTGARTPAAEDSGSGFTIELTGGDDGTPDQGRGDR